MSSKTIYLYGVYSSKGAQGDLPLTLAYPSDADHAAILEDAVAEARRAGIVYEGERVDDAGEPRIHIDDLRAGLRIYESDRDEWR